MYDTVKRSIERYIKEKGKKCIIKDLEEAKTIMSLRELLTEYEQDKLSFATGNLSYKLFSNAYNMIDWHNKNKKI